MLLSPIVDKEMSCKSGFELTTSNNCALATCPTGFKRIQEGPTIRCVHNTDNSIAFMLTQISPTARDDVYRKEITRVQTESTSKLQTALQQVQREGAQNVASYSRIQGEQAGFRSLVETNQSLQEVSQSLKPFRPPTAPESDIAQERSRILNSSAPNMLVIQVSLAIVLICALAYAFMPPTYAGFLSFLLLSVGIALGIFLRK